MVGQWCCSEELESAMEMVGSHGIVLARGMLSLDLCSRKSFLAGV